MPKIEYSIMEFVIVAAVMLASIYCLLPASIRGGVLLIDNMKGWFI